MPRAYLKVPFNEQDALKQYCRQFGLHRPIFDWERRLWFYPAVDVPAALTNLYPIVELSDLGPTLPAPPGKAAAAGLIYTDEQKLAIATEPGGTNNALILRAGAGAAKTTTLRAYAAARPESRFLYLAFGRANSAEAQKTFPPNTVCKTTHALAYAWLPEQMRHKLPDMKKGGSDPLKPDVICDLLGFKRSPEHLLEGHIIRQLLYAYWTSTDIHPGLIHIDSIRNLLDSGACKINCSPDDLVRYARITWEFIINPSHSAPLTPDAFLKYYALSQPDWSNEFDYVALDEAQDTNPVVEEMVFQQNIKKIIVGDSHQNIYSFRRARDILTPRADQGNPCLYLTNSFRYGPEVARIANIILKDFKSETHALVGRGDKAEVYSPGNVDWELHEDGRFTSFTFINRNNSTLFEAAIDTINCLEAYELVTGRDAPKIGFIGTSEAGGFSPYYAYKFNRLVDLVNLARNTPESRLKIKDPFLARFARIDDLIELLSQEGTRDPEMSGALKLFARYRNALPLLIKKIMDRCRDPSSPEVWIRFTTAHKSKGLEWPRVRLANDFPSLEQGISDDEINLLYVAVTRARTELELNCRVTDYLEMTNQTDAITCYMKGSDSSGSRKLEDYIRSFNRRLGQPEDQANAIIGRILQERAARKAESEKRFRPGELAPAPKN